MERGVRHARRDERLLDGPGAPKRQRQGAGLGFEPRPWGVPAGLDRDRCPSPPARKPAQVGVGGGRKRRRSGRNVIKTGGGSLGTAGALTLAGRPRSCGSGGSAAGRSGSGPDSIWAFSDGVFSGGPFTGDGVPGAAPVADATDAFDATTGGAGAGGTGAGGAGGAVAASITATDAPGSGGGTAGGGDAAGLAFAPGCPPGFSAAAMATGSTNGSWIASRSVRSRSEAKRVASARRVAASVITGAGGTCPRFGYGSLTPGGGGRASAIFPPCRPCHQLIGVSSVSLLSLGCPMALHAGASSATNNIAGLAKLRCKNVTCPLPSRRVGSNLPQSAIARPCSTHAGDM